MAISTVVHASRPTRSNGSRSQVLRLTRTQYRQFAEQTKAVGLGLNVSTHHRMGCWGQYSPWALLVVSDAGIDAPKFEERALITIASSINADAFRAAGATRPEMDWSVLDDSEIYPFVLQHEIGHRQDNFDSIAVQCSERGSVDRAYLHSCLRVINEVLADRYAWSRVRPGQPIPLNDRGKRLQREISERLGYLAQHAKKRTPCKPEWQMKPGAYYDVPDYMLATSSRAAFIGPKVSPLLLESRRSHYREYNQRRPDQPLF